MVTASFTEFPCDRSLAPIPEWDAVEPAATARLTRSRERAITQRKRAWSLRPLLNRPGGQRLSPAQDVGLGRRFELDKTHNTFVAKSKFPQANPSPAKPIQTKRLGFAWFYSSESGLINGLQRIQIKIFLLTPSPCRQALRMARLRFWAPDIAGATSRFSQGHESKNCGVLRPAPSGGKAGEEVVVQVGPHLRSCHTSQRPAHTVRLVRIGAGVAAQLRSRERWGPARKAG